MPGIASTGSLAIRETRWLRVIRPKGETIEIGNR